MSKVITAEIRTCSGAVLAWDENLHKIISCHPDIAIPARHPLVAILFGNDNVVLTTISFDIPISFSGNASPQIALGLRILHNPDRSKSHLYDPNSGLYMSARPVKSKDAPCEPVTLDRALASTWESFSVHETVASNFSSSLLNFLNNLKYAEISEIIEAQLFSNDFVLAKTTIEALSPLLQRNELSILVEKLSSEAAALANVGRIFSEDIWATDALPDLVTWLRKRRVTPSENTKAILELPKAFNSAASRSVSGFVSFPYACNEIARKNVTPTKDICVIATARNEGLYLLEWLSHYMSLGIDKFFLYCNDNNDGSDDLLQALAAAGVIDLTYNNLHQGVPPQYKAYGHALSVRPEILDYSWAVIVDLDEFIMLDENYFSKLQDFLHWHDSCHADAVALNWFLFGSNGQASFDNELVIKRFQMREAVANSHIKSLFRPSMFVHSHCHFPIRYRNEKFMFKNASRSEHKYEKTRNQALSDQPEANFAWINHYYFKSFEEYVAKLSKGRNDFSGGVASGIVSHETTPGRVNNMLSGALAKLKESNQEWDGRALKRSGSVETIMHSLLAIDGVEEGLAKIRSQAAISMMTAKMDLLTLSQDIVEPKVLREVREVLKI